MDKLKLGIIGIGNMGRGHLKNVESGKVPGVEVVALCDTDPEALKPWDAKYQRFSDSKAMIRSGAVEAVLVATPHYDHTTIGIDALQQGLHLLVEKPISVHKADAERLIAAYQKRPRKGQVFGAMFNQRTHPAHRKIRSLVQGGELGEIRRINWIITTWFRTAAYYASGGWRATWGGEGGGVLLNQCPHQLDLLWWFCGMPDRVQAHCRFGQWHDIEVEDDVTAYLRYPNGATGVFITTTGEAPGTNRLEIVGERGRLVFEDDKISFLRNEFEMGKFCRTSSQGFGKPEFWKIEVPTRGEGGAHAEILQNFAEATRGKAELLAPAVEGLHSVELANAMLLSTFLGKAIDLPVDGRVYERELKKRIAASAGRKKKPAGRKASAGDFAKSF